MQMLFFLININSIIYQPCINIYESAWLLPRFFYAVVCDWIEHVQKFNIFNTLWNLINRLASVQRRNKNIYVFILKLIQHIYIQFLYIICYFFIISKIVHSVSISVLCVAQFDAAQNVWWWARVKQRMERHKINKKL